MMKTVILVIGNANTVQLQGLTVLVVLQLSMDQELLLLPVRVGQDSTTTQLHVKLVMQIVVHVVLLAAIIV